MYGAAPLIAVIFTEKDDEWKFGWSFAAFHVMRCVPALTAPFAPSPVSVLSWRSAPVSLSVPSGNTYTSAFAFASSHTTV